MKMPGRPDVDYDVVVIGGALSGAGTAWLLRQWCPQARILIVERTEQFSRKVGEATVEVSGHYLSRVLGLYDELSRHHLAKHGLRYWFADGPERSLFEMSEVGPNRLPTMASFQLDRSRLDEEMLRRVGEAGVEVARPAQVKELQLGWPIQRVAFSTEAQTRQVTCRWVVDASGRQGLLAKRLDLRLPNPQHPTAAAWARWRGVQDMDSPRFTDAMGHPLPRVFPSRRAATNHFSGPGWWCWVIPLSGGETSIGVVYDKRLFDLPGQGRMIDRYRDFVRAQAGLRDLVAQAQIDQDDFLAYKDLCYFSKRYMDHGWAMVGDAAGFMDPLYSPGLDHVAFSSYATAALLRDDLAGRLDDMARTKRIDRHNRQFTGSYQRWMQTIYLDKYHIFGDPELVTSAYNFDIGMYYLGVVGSVFRKEEHLIVPPLGVTDPIARTIYAFMRVVKRRMVNLAQTRKRIGFVSPRQYGWRYFPTKFELGSPAVRLVVHGLAWLARAQCQTWWWQLRRMTGLLPANKPMTPATRPVESPLSPPMPAAAAGTPPAPARAGAGSHSVLGAGVPAPALVLRIAAHAQNRPHDYAVYHADPDGQTVALTWAQWLSNAATVAQYLRQRTEPGAVVMIGMYNRPDFYSALLGTLLADRQVFPVSPEATAAELASLVQRADVRAVIGETGFVEQPPFQGGLRLDRHELAQLPAADPGSLLPLPRAHAALLLVSSGTTGLPKIVRRSLSSLDVMARNCAQAVGLTPADRVLLPVVLHHSYGLEHGLLGPAHAGATVELHSTMFDVPGLKERLIGRQITVFPGVPFIFEALSQVFDEPTAHTAPLALRRAYSAGGVLPAGVWEACRRRLGVALGQVYGSTEIGSITFNDPLLPDYDPLAVGRLFPGVEVRLAQRPDPAAATVEQGDEGFVLVRSNSMFDGYVDSPHGKLPQGWFDTGDLGRMDAQGRLRITGRAKLLIDIDGRKVNPLEVESVLTQHQDVQEAVVIGLRVTETASRLKALIVPRAGAWPDEEALRRFTRERLSAFKVPRVFEICHELPRTAIGKVNREALR